MRLRLFGDTTLSCDLIESTKQSLTSIYIVSIASHGRRAGTTDGATLGSRKICAFRKQGTNQDLLLSADTICLPVLHRPRLNTTLLSKGTLGQPERFTNLFHFISSHIHTVCKI